MRKDKAVSLLQILICTQEIDVLTHDTVSVMSLFSNPMILIALFSLGVVVGMPYLMENMDPETKAEFEAMQKERGVGANPMAAAQNFDLAGWMAGSKPDEAAEDKPAIEAYEGGGKKKNRKNR